MNCICLSRMCPGINTNTISSDKSKPKRFSDPDSRSDPGSFRSYSLSVRSFRPDFRGGSFRPSFGGSFRPTLFYIDF